MKLDAVAITSKDFKKTVKFYNLLGFSFPDFSDDERHIEPITKSGEVRLMIDDAELITSIMGTAPIPPTHSSFAMLCNSANEVDEVVNKIKASGFEIVKEPWDAFWGQRYAIIKDPDGYMIDLFAYL
jgi:predicted lactoylglutathione lyase